VRVRQRSMLRAIGAMGVAAALLATGSPPTFAATASWTRQFGTAGYEWVEDVAVSGGIAYAAGHAHDRLPGCDAAGELFVRAVSAEDGSLLWCRQYGASDDLMSVGGIAADATGVYVAGSLFQTLPGQSSHGRQDAFVRRYDLAGDVVWTRQFGTHRLDAATDIALGGEGVDVLGTTNDGLGGPSAGLDDLFVRRYDLNGVLRWTTQFGTSASDQASGIAADSGGAYVAGSTEGTFHWQASPTAESEGFVVRLGARGGEQWHRRVDGPGADAVRGLAIDGDGLTVVGNAPGIEAQRLFGSDGVFVRRYGVWGAVRWTRTFGSDAFGDVADHVASDPSGIYVVGSTYGALPGAADRGRADAFVVALDPAGALAWTDEFGSRQQDELFGAAVGAGQLVVAGATWGGVRGPSRGVADAVLRGYAVSGAA
jgi:hypothetical protein